MKRILLSLLALFFLILLLLSPGTALEGAHRHHNRLLGGSAATGDGLERGDDLSSRYDHIGTQVGLGAVGAPAPESNGKGIGGSADGP